MTRRRAKQKPKGKEPKRSEFDEHAIELTETCTALIFEKPSFIDCFDCKEELKQGRPI